MFETNDRSFRVFECRLLDDEFDELVEGYDVGNLEIELSPDLVQLVGLLSEPVNQRMERAR